MTTAIGVVMTEHIVAGRLEDHRLVGEPVRYPQRHRRSGRADASSPVGNWSKFSPTRSRSPSVKARAASMQSASRFPASCAMAWSRTRPI